MIVLDLMLPEIDGLTVLRQLRERGKTTHVLILSARDLVEDRIQGLRHGADDYLVKPFSFDELCARLEALVRRSYQAKNPWIRIGPLEINTAARQVTLDGREVRLTPREYSLLEILMLRAGEVLSRRELWDRLYDFESEAGSNVVDVLVCSLRKKLDPDDPQSLIKTRRGQGYLIEAQNGAREGAMRSLRGRLTVWLLAGTGLLLVAGGLLLDRVIGTRLLRELDTALTEQAKSLQASTEQQHGTVVAGVRRDRHARVRARQGSRLLPALARGRHRPRALAGRSGPATSPTAERHRPPAPFLRHRPARRQAGPPGRDQLSPPDRDGGRRSSSPLPRQPRSPWWSPRAARTSTPSSPRCT